MLPEIIAQMAEEGRLPKQIIQAFEAVLKDQAAKEARIKALETAL